MRVPFRVGGLFIGAVVVATSLAAQGPSPDERVAALKRSLQESQARIRQYEWIETTVISLKGEEKARSQKRCYYGADGKLQKLPVAGAVPPQAAEGGGRGGRGGRLKQRVVENKKDEMQDYMERAANLVHMYIPPDPGQIQASKDAGKMSVRVLEANKGVSLEFADYLQPGDRLAVQVDPAGARLLALSVASYLEKPDEAVTLDVRFGALQDATSYAAETALEAKAKNIRVVISNSGHRKMSLGASKGARASGRVTEGKSGTGMGGEPVLAMQLTDIETGGYVFAMDTRDVRLTAKGKGPAKKIAGGALLGAGTGAVIARPLTLTILESVASSQ